MRLSLAAWLTHLVDGESVTRLRQSRRQFGAKQASDLTTHDHLSFLFSRNPRLRGRGHDTRRGEEVLLVDGILTNTLQKVEKQEKKKTRMLPPMFANVCESY